MNRAYWMIAFAMACCAAAVGWSGGRLGAAVQERIAAEARLAHLNVNAQELLDLRGREQAVGENLRPDQDVIAQVTATLASVGLPSDRLKDLGQVSDVAARESGIGGPEFREQTVRFTLEPITPRELGEFFNGWRSAQCVWTVRQIELSHAADEGDPGFRAALQIVSLYVSDPVSPAVATAPRLESP